MKRRRSQRREPDVMSPKILNAAQEVSDQLTKRGYPHVLIGGLAVRHYGYKRTTSDVDFLVSSDVADQIAGDALGGVVRGKSFRTAGNVTIDILFPKDDESFLEAEIRKADGGTISEEGLVYLKLEAGRMKDQADITELAKRGKLNVSSIKKFLTRHRPDLVDEFESLVEIAALEK